MASQTTNYKLTKPSSTDKYNIDVFNNNTDILDTTLKSQETKISNIETRATSLEKVGDFLRLGGGSDYTLTWNASYTDYYNYDFGTTAASAGSTFSASGTTGILVNEACWCLISGAIELNASEATYQVRVNKSYVIDSGSMSGMMTIVIPTHAVYCSKGDIITANIGCSKACSSLTRRGRSFLQLTRIK